MSDTTVVTDTAKIPIMTKQVAGAYKDAVDNLMFLKKEQVQIAYYTWLLLAAVYILSQRATENQKAFLATGVVLVGILSVTIILSFHFAMGRIRRRLAYIYENYFNKAEQKGLLLDAGGRSYITSLMVAACIVAAGFTVTLVL